MSRFMSDSSCSPSLAIGGFRSYRSLGHDKMLAFLLSLLY